jgi:hypothetical protein
MSVPVQYTIYELDLRSNEKSKIDVASSLEQAHRMTLEYMETQDEFTLSTFVLVQRGSGNIYVLGMRQTEYVPLHPAEKIKALLAR